MTVLHDVLVCSTDSGVQNSEPEAPLMSTTNPPSTAEPMNASSPQDPSTNTGFPTDEEGPVPSTTPPPADGISDHSDAITTISKSFSTESWEDVDNYEDYFTYEQYGTCGFFRIILCSIAILAASLSRITSKA